MFEILKITKTFKNSKPEISKFKIQILKMILDLKKNVQFKF